MIRFTLTYLRPVALFLTMIFLLQWCKAYYKEPVSIEQAIRSDKRQVKVITNDGRKYVFDSIYYKNDKVYGHLKVKNKSELMIPEESIKEIHLVNITKSRILTALTIIIPVGIFLAFQLAPPGDE